MHWRKVLQHRGMMYEAEISGGPAVGREKNASLMDSYIIQYTDTVVGWLITRCSHSRHVKAEADPCQPLCCLIRRMRVAVELERFQLDRVPSGPQPRALLV